MKDRHQESHSPVSAGAVRGHYDALARAYDRKSNRALKHMCAWLIAHWLRDAERVLELGAGAGKLVDACSARFAVACDLSPPMLRARRKNSAARRCAADAHQTPFSDGCFDAVCSINMLEHAANPNRVLAETARVLKTGGLCLFVTPNGDLERMLDLLERLHLKLPEGPHRFLGFDDLARTATGAFEIIQHRRFAVFPIGPRVLVQAIDRIAQRVFPRLGLFQYIVLRRRVSC